MGDVEDRFFKLKVSQWSLQSLPANVINLNKILALPGLAGTPKGKSTVHCLQN